MEPHYTRHIWSSRIRISKIIRSPSKSPPSNTFFLPLFHSSPNELESRNISWFLFLCNSYFLKNCKPRIPNSLKNHFVAGGYNKRPTFFGCRMEAGPLIIYLPNYFASHRTDMKTLQTDFTVSERPALLFWSRSSNVQGAMLTHLQFAILIFLQPRALNDFREMRLMDSSRIVSWLQPKRIQPSMIPSGQNAWLVPW
jgi:hypothetical protein